ncbi:methyltransferase domain-containing protein [Sphingomonas sp.]|jgi:ubiquinone/menaquinone biosynthesis C-methylase UbiE|uniref:methyltransferase domain-containing protein n=1 Tax=Sphingomonas sp. TaxID=28214 RepID=UPI002D7F2830|nr:methyltransferase domain-containing protein [Sphingomonas sp.]HEU0045931.1 methyltransferase domain-containing protein [Sphingomonas sp.]
MFRAERTDVEDHAAKLTPRLVWRTASFGKASLLDGYDRISGRNDGLRPPRRASFVGSGDFDAAGAEFRKLFIEIGGLKPSDAVLDVGSGIGRMAVPLTTYLTGGGRLEGFDIVRSGVQWCQKNISSRYPNFQFRHVDVFSKEYNPQGKLQGKDFDFPYPDATFDFVFLTSVFTHMLDEDIKNYLAEIARVTKPGGRSFITWLVLDDEAKANVAGGRAAQNVVHPQGAGFVANRDVPEEAIAFPLETVRALYAEAGLRLLEPIRFGSWSGRKDGVTFQDIVVAERP